jgi:hypothetical protein
VSQYFFEYKDGYTERLYQCIVELNDGYLVDLAVFDGEDEIKSTLIKSDALNYFEIYE